MSTASRDWADPSDATLGELVSQFEAAGHTGQMAARPGGRLLCFTCRTESDAADVQLVDLRRLEGASDPDDMLAVAAVVCPHCGTRSTVVLGYGPEAAQDDAEALVRLQADGRA